MTNNEILATTINDWLNANSINYKGYYDLMSSYNPLEVERVSNTLNFFKTSPDYLSKEEIENDKIRGVLQTGIARQNELSGIDAVVLTFQANFMVDASKTTVFDDINSFKNKYNGSVTSQVLTDGTYSMAWGFNSLVSSNTINKNGVRILNFMLSGTVAINLYNSTTLRQVDYGDFFSLSLKKKGGSSWISGEDIFSFSLTKENIKYGSQTFGLTEDTETLQQYTGQVRTLKIMILLTELGTLGNLFLKDLIGDDNTTTTLNEIYEIRFTRDRTATTTDDVSYWENALFLRSSVAVKLGDFVLLEVDFAKSQKD